MARQDLGHCHPWAIAARGLVRKKSWSLRYRNLSNAQRRFTLGAYPALSLTEARSAARRALGAVAEERDPADERQARKVTASAASLKPQTLADLWAFYETENLPRLRTSTASYHRWLWKKHIHRRLGRLSIADVDRGAVRAALREIGSSAPVQANRSMSLVRRLLNIAVDYEIITASPLSNLTRLYPEVSRDRVLSDRELAVLWRAFETAASSYHIGVSRHMILALKLLLLTGVRAGDVAGLHADEIDETAGA